MQAIHEFQRNEKNEFISSRRPQRVIFSLFPFLSLEVIRHVVSYRKAHITPKNYCI